MNNYTIIEDCSPYYIRFTHKGIDNIIDACKKITDKTVYTKAFTHHKVDNEVGEDIIELLPMSNQLKIKKDRVSIFITQPGVYYRTHKDGADHRCSINYTIKVLDDQCVTSWYSDDDLQRYKLDGNLTLQVPGYQGREVEGFVKSNHVPLKSMVAIQGECILFNTDIYHDWDNTTSQCERIVLTLRLENPGTMYFDDVKKILFE
jgi:hypothetical protein